jgi:hypothetical protein
LRFDVDAPKALGAYGCERPNLLVVLARAIKRAAHLGTGINVRDGILTSTQLGLGATAAPVDLDVGLARSQGSQSARFKEPRQPERVMAYFIAGQITTVRRSLGPAVSGWSMPSAFFCFAASDWINARLLPIRKLDGQQSTLLAQF